MVSLYLLYFYILCPINQFINQSCNGFNPQGNSAEIKWEIKGQAASAPRVSGVHLLSISLHKVDKLSILIARRRICLCVVWDCLVLATKLWAQRIAKNRERTLLYSPLLVKNHLDDFITALQNFLPVDLKLNSYTQAWVNEWLKLRQNMSSRCFSVVKQIVIEWNITNLLNLSIVSKVTQPSSSCSCSLRNLSLGRLWSPK